MPSRAHQNQSADPERSSWQDLYRLCRCCRQNIQTVGNQGSKQRTGPHNYQVVYRAMPLLQLNRARYPVPYSSQCRKPCSYLRASDRWWSGWNFLLGFQLPLRLCQDSDAVGHRWQLQIPKHAQLLQRPIQAGRSEDILQGIRDLHDEILPRQRCCCSHLPYHAKTNRSYQSLIILLLYNNTTQ